MAPTNSSAVRFLAGLMVESIFYGMFLITFCACLQQLLLKKDHLKSAVDINFSLLFVVLILFVTTSLNQALELLRCIRTFDVNGAQDERWLDILKPTILNIQLLLTDSIMIYRCWLVWDKSLLLVLTPLLFWVGATVSTVYKFYLHVVFGIGPRALSGPVFVLSATAIGSTIVINMYSTGMILYKIWLVERAWTPPSICSLRYIPQRGRLQFAKRIIMESGLLYTTSTLLFFVLHLCKSPGVYIVAVAEIQIAGIAFNLIVMRSADASTNSGYSIPMYASNSDASPEGIAAQTQRSL